MNKRDIWLIVTEKRNDDDSVADWGEPGIRAEFARLKAWRARARLDALIRDLPLSADDEMIRQELEWAISDVESTLKILQQK